MHIVLLGYMGCGKSVVGKHLAKKLNIPFMDLDKCIETKESSSISFVFKEKGEIYFRELESICLKELLSQNTKSVISLGGGTPCYGNNMELINRKTQKSIYLKASVDTLVRRLIGEKTLRPIIAHLNTENKLKEFIQKHLFERNIYYLKANYIIDIDNMNISDIAREIKGLRLFKD